MTVFKKANLNGPNSPSCWVRTIFLAGAAFCPALASAQDAEISGDGSVEAEGKLTEIVVTAQKRSENVQRVPIAISAIGQTTLETTGFDNLANLAKIAPSVQFGSFGPVAFINMRGIGNENTTAGGDPGVALHYDGVYLARPVGSLFSAFDTERVEVLRGPQGTLYGRNATGGSVNYVTVKPDDELGVSADLTLGNYDWRRARGVLNLPLTDDIQTRMVAFIDKRDGFTKNDYPGGTLANDADSWGLRDHLLITPSSNLKVLLSATYVESNGVGSHPELREPFPGSQTGQTISGPPIPGYNDYLVDGTPLVNDLRPFHEAKNRPESQDNSLLLLSGTVDLDLGPVAIKSISGYVRSRYSSEQDNDGSSKDLSFLHLDEKSKAFSQELQLLSTGSGPLKWIVGAFYFDEDAFRDSHYSGGRFDIIANNTGQPYGFFIKGDVEARSYAFFGQTTYEILDGFRLTGGLRYTNDRKTGTNEGFLLQGSDYSGDVKGKWDRVTWRAAADYQVTPSILLYGSYSTGYKSGGINQQVNPATGNAVFAPEYVKAAEAGFKSRLLDDMVQLNATAYRNRYDNLQFQVLGPLGPLAYNAAGATAKGVEVELQAVPADWLRIDASSAYTDAKFDSQIIDGTDIGGNRVQRTPEWTANLGTTFTWYVGDSRMRFRADYSYTGSIYYSALNRDGGPSDPGGSDLAPHYQNVDARLFYETPDERWELEAFVTNIFDTTQIGNVFRSIGFEDVAGGGGLELITYKAPRQFGVRVGYKL